MQARDLSLLLYLAGLAVFLTAWHRESWSSVRPRIIPRIIGGHPVSIRQFPWFAMLGGAGGVLIAPDVVLTAAHLAVPSAGVKVGQPVIIGGQSKNLSAARITAIQKAVREGLTSPSQRPDAAHMVAYLEALNGGEARIIRKVVMHPKFSMHPDPAYKGSFFPYDVALVFFDSPSTITPLDLASQLPKDGQPVTLVGAGATTTAMGFSITHRNMDNPLKSVQLDYTSPSRAVALLYKHKQALEKNTLNGYDIPTALYMARHPASLTAIATNGSSGCHGDSGSPLIVTDANGRQSLVGIVSGGSDSCTPLPIAFNFFGNVPYLLPWIQNELH